MFSATAFQRKWKSLRDSFSRELLKQKQTKSGSGAKNRKQYIYFHQLSFLQIVSKNTTSSLTEEVPVDGPTEADEIMEVNMGGEGPGKKPLNKKRKIQKEVEEENALLNVIKERISKEDTRPGPHITFDEDTMFLLSLVPELKKVPETSKLDVKMEILSVFKRQTKLPRTSNFASTSYQYGPITQNHQDQAASVHHQPLHTYTSLDSSTISTPILSPTESQYSQYSDTSFIDFNV